MQKKSKQTVLRAVSHFYCDKCKEIRPLKGKPLVSGKNGRYQGSFVCAACGFERSIQCDVCRKAQPVEIEKLSRMDDRSFLAGDILCSYCRYIIATVFKETAGPALKESMRTAERGKKRAD
jgi:hypothetical protein